MKSLWRSLWCLLVCGGLFNLSRLAASRNSQQPLFRILFSLPGRAGGVQTSSQGHSGFFFLKIDREFINAQKATQVVLPTPRNFALPARK